MVIRKKKNGVYAVRIQTEFGEREISTRCKDKDAARKVIKESKVADLEAVGKASKLTTAAVSAIISGKRVKMGKALVEWERWMQSVGRSKRTMSSKLVWVSAWIRDMGLEDSYPSAVTEKNIAGWINDPKDDSKFGTRRVKLSCLSSFFGYCAAKGWSMGDPTHLVPVNMSLMSQEQKEPKIREAFTDDEVYTLLQNAEGFWHSAIAIGRWTGLRLGDICQLEWSSFSRPGKIIVWTDKRDRRVELAIDVQLEPSVAKIPYVDQTYCFPDERAIILDESKRSTLSTTFRRLCEKLGIEGKSFHCLRHSYAQACAKDGTPMPHIARQMGHQSIFTTQGYVGRGKGD